MTVKEFINQVFLNEYKRIIDLGFHYISFALIALGIEYLGACLDSNDFGQEGLSKARFTSAINELFVAKYHGHAEALYKHVRCGFAHQSRPGSGFALTHRNESTKENTQHLVPFGRPPFDNSVVLIAEEFYADFASACSEVINRIDSGVLSHPKFSKSFLRTT